MKKTYDAYVNGILKSGLTRIQLESYRTSGYIIQVIACYKNDENDYNSIAIKEEEY